MNESPAPAETHEKTRWLATVRYGDLRHIATFETNLPDLRPNEKVVVRTERGTEAGTHLGIPVPLDSTGNTPGFMGRVLRRLGPKDREELLAIQDRYQPSAVSYCKEKVKESQLPMDLVSAEQLLGGEKLIFYFQSEARVDFRNLVKDLAGEFKCRIEMRQIGARDEARILGDFGPCGRELCCKGHLTELQAVSMKMVKTQSTTLDPSKITGRCGRLKCCLRYEDATYLELRKSLPKRGAHVHTVKGKGEVVNVDILSQAVVVWLASGERVRMPVSDITGAMSEQEIHEERMRQELAAERAQERLQRLEARQAKRHVDGRGKAPALPGRSPDGGPQADASLRAEPEPASPPAADSPSGDPAASEPAEDSDLE